MAGKYLHTSAICRHYYAVFTFMQFFLSTHSANKIPICLNCKWEWSQQGGLRAKFRTFNSSHRWVANEHHCLHMIRLIVQLCSRNCIARLYYDSFTNNDDLGDKKPSSASVVNNCLWDGRGTPVQCCIGAGSIGTRMVFPNGLNCKDIFVKKYWHRISLTE